jgi:hypothetical protein
VPPHLSLGIADRPSENRAEKSKQASDSQMPCFTLVFVPKSVGAIAARRHPDRLEANLRHNVNVVGVRQFQVVPESRG